jgi:DNA polymerase I-like protein with 3'-5' exonuclease and polymerase domains
VTPLLVKTATFDELKAGQLFVKDSGLAFERMLGKVGLNRDNLRFAADHNLPSDCGGVVVALGERATTKLLGLEKPAILEHRTQGRRGYVEWSDLFKCWVIPTYDPDWLQKGNWAKIGVFLGDLQRGIEIAANGFQYRSPRTIEDPSPGDFLQWVLRSGTGPLAFDIETPGKAKAAEDELDFADATPIERVSFACRVGEGISVPWSDAYIPAIRHLLAANRRYYVWNRSFDKPRLESNGVRFGGPVEDVMYAWHVLQPDLPMNINYVGSIFLPHYERWKYQHWGRPAYYSAVDSAALFDLADAIFKGLEETDQLNYYKRYIHEMTDCLEVMTKPGIPLDWEARVSLSKQLTDDQEKALAAIQTVIPEELFKFDPPAGFVRTPKDTSGLFPLVTEANTKVCQRCGAEGVTKGSHTGKKSFPCFGAEIAVETRQISRYARRLPFSPSNQQLLGYAKFRSHKPILGEPKEDGSQSPTFDGTAVEKLKKLYPDDPLYPLLQEYKEPEKLLGFVGKLGPDGSLVGGWPSRNGRLYPVFGHTPATGRFNCKQPNLQQVPRADERDPTSLLLRGIFKPEPGTAIVEIDYSAIEAVLVGYFANDRWFTRLAKLGVHDYLNSHILHRRGLISEPADVSWSDSDLKECFGGLKKRFERERHMAKTVVYLSLYMGSANRIFMSNPEIFKTLKNAQEIQALLFDLFPNVRKWQWDTTALAADQGYLRGIWGQARRFYKVWEWKKTREGGWERRPGSQAKEAVNFLIQHAAAGILKNAVLMCREERPDIFQHLRLLIHDSIFSYLPLTNLIEMGATLEAIMRRPITAMPLDSEWNMGSHLHIGTEAKVGYNSWAEAKKAPW